MSEIKCPFCDSTDFELFSLFGQTLLGSQYYCNSCRSIFESVRYDDQQLEGNHQTDKQKPGENLEENE